VKVPGSFESLDYGRFDELAEEFAERYRRGERPSLQEYIDRLPAMADAIREMFPAMVEVEQAEVDARAEGSPPPRSVTPHLREIGDYRILREVGRGGMGVVYEAEQVSLGRRVALKVLPGPVVGDRKTQQRFLREAKAAARLHHTNIVPVFEVGRDRDVSFYAMQLIQGQGLEQVIDELRRLRDPGLKAKAHGPAGLESRAGSGPGTPDQGGASSKLQNRELGQMAELLLSGRLATEGPGSPLSSASAAAGLGPTERFDPDASSAQASKRPNADPSLASPVSGSANTAVLPGGKHVSEVDTSGRRQPFYRSVAQIGRQAAHGLAHAHARGIVHRDVKPSNLLLDTDGVVWITDFGLAKAEDDDLTASGDILGTLRYMAPERFRGVGDARADIYALGLTLYELLTLRPAYKSSDRLKLIEQIKSQEPSRPRSIDGRIPRDLETIVLKAIDKLPDRRYATIDAMGEDLRRFLADEPIRARQISATERYWRWARRNPTIASLGALLTGVLVLVTIGSLRSARRFADLAERQGNSAAAERSSRLEADIARAAADTARAASEKSRAAAESETYRAMLSEAKALRAGHQPGWREESLANLARLAVMPTPRRNLVELRTEATASLATPDIRLAARIELPVQDLRAFSFSPDGRTLLTAGHQTRLDFWDVYAKRHIASADGLAVTEPGFDKAAYLPDGRGLVLATRDSGVVFTDERGIRTPRVPITQGASKPIKLAVAAKGQRIAVSWADASGITVHEADSGTLIERFDGSPFALSPDGRWLARQEQGDIVLHPIGSGAPKVVLDRQAGVRAFAFSPDGTMLAGACEDHTTILWDVVHRTRFGTLRGHRERVNDVAFSPDSEWVATVAGDYTLRIWDARTVREIATLSESNWMRQVEWSPDGKYVAMSTDSSRTVFLYEIIGRHDVQQWLTGHSVEIRRVAAHPRLKQFMTLAYSELIHWDASVPQPTHRRFGTEPGAGMALAYSPDGAFVATGSWSGSPVPSSDILVRDSQTREVRHRLSCPRIVQALAFDPSVRCLASADDLGSIIIWDLATDRPIRRIETGSNRSGSIAFLDGDRRLVTSGKDAIFLYNIQTGELERRVTLPGVIELFVIDRERNRLIAAFQNGAISSVSLPELTLGHRLENAHQGSFASLALSPDGRLLATAGVDRRVVLRNPLSFEPLLNFPMWVGNLRETTFDSTSQRLAIVGTDSKVDLWNLAALNKGLADIGLACDRPAPTPTDAAPDEGPAPRLEVVVIHPGKTDSAELEKAGDLVQSGVAAFREGRFAQAIVELQQASEKLQTLRRSRPTDAPLARLHGTCLGFLAGSLRDSRQPGDALSRAREALGVYESLNDPNAGDLYNMACDCALVSALNDRGSPHDHEKLEARAMGYLRRALDGDAAQIQPMLATDRDLDSLRNRADFRGLVADAKFPRDPFAQPFPR
jgi:eukaryotic-like serine/threonine-protein kinase